MTTKKLIKTRLRLLLKSFLICLSILNSSCQTWQPSDYKFVYAYHPKIGGGVKFGVLSHKFEELTQEQIQDLMLVSVLLPPETWELLSIDLIKACIMLGKKCERDVQVLNDVFKQLKVINTIP